MCVIVVWTEFQCQKKSSAGFLVTRESKVGRTRAEFLMTIYRVILTDKSRTLSLYRPGQALMAAGGCSCKNL
jgi:glycerol-3-phosphate responsive antiterminator